MGQGEFEVTDYYKKKFTGSALDLVLFMLTSFYSTQENAKKTHSLLSEQLMSIGSCYLTDKTYG